MKWYIVYKCKPRKDSLTENLQKAGIEYYVPLYKHEVLKDNTLVIEEQNALYNLVFIRTDQDIHQFCTTIDGLKSPYYNLATNTPATVSDHEMQCFIQIIHMKNIDVQFLQDSFRRFSTGQKVRVRAGDFEGLEGYVFRIRRDRKLIISLGDIAIAISGIHHTLLETVE